LARIRDNQRRSRARRKGYLQELEVKYRECEQTGVEASAEIQTAARKVVDENKRLRQLLKQQGLSDAEINGLSTESAETNAANELEAMLGTRKPCGTECSNSNSSRAMSCSTTSSSTQVERYDNEPTQQAAMQSNAPSSTVQATNASTNLHLLLPATTTSSDHDRFPTLALPYSPTLDWIDSHEVSQDFYLSQSLPETTGTSSCYTAAEVVRSIHPGLGPELEHELGCCDGNECTVPNSCIFQVIDRYSADE
jgi:hypothetical protein